ncbi:MAG: hypothetical protein CMM16_03810 [Rhodospirillaceae bacterium]|nr:hypothetical protein [Rhodospirillaceae bacterium]
MFKTWATFLATVLVLAMLIPFKSLADPAPRDITWADLAPGGTNKREYLRGVSPLAALVLSAMGNERPKPEMAGDFDGKEVRLSGYIIPLEFSNGGVQVFLLVPYVGACIHVPPPPKNQIVMVSSPRPIQPRSLFEAVTVTGLLSIAESRTGLAETGYRLTASDVSRYRLYRHVKRLQDHSGAETNGK